ncbi:hypothetical protein Nepgr_015616 [Nepenthes gracilis]|uniref:glucan endo-1,3-beta-D-glucosidase n=1 Tax=Nepenthes gracilis TaxID=150966 RepID=A0AAD3SLC1_NEPGR|nr:hypothetical protein Nepgr_015616 [Nepenthes gracilis]
MQSFAGGSARRLQAGDIVPKGLVVGGLGLGCNWGLKATHLLPPDIVVKLMKDNGFNKVKLFEADQSALEALGNSGIQVIVGVPNEMLALLAGSVQAAVNWVSQNVSTFISHNGVDIRYVAVGNEPFLKTYGDTYQNTTFPALQNVQAALIEAGLGQKVKATIPLNADVYQTASGLPSGGNFRSDIYDLMISIIKFLDNNGAPIIVNIYPFISLYNDPNFPINYAFFDDSSNTLIDGSMTYTNVLDANYDTLISALEVNGFGSMPIIIGEVGWPTDGDTNANINYAQRFNQGLINRILQGKGTPKRSTPPDIYIFSLIDEDAKSIQPGNFERHWGMFYYDGSVKYKLDMGNNRSLVAAEGVKYLERRWCVISPQANFSDPNFAPSISYACSYADCTSLGYGSSCGALDAAGNASYAYNMYYQTMNQTAGSCQFGGLATTTTTDPSQGSCRFEIQIDISKHQKTSSHSSSWATRLQNSLMVDSDSDAAAGQNIHKGEYQIPSKREIFIEQVEQRKSTKRYTDGSTSIYLWLMLFLKVPVKECLLEIFTVAVLDCRIGLKQGRVSCPNDLCIGSRDKTSAEGRKRGY